ncbi:Sec-independent protein translocase protein TatB [Corallococcus sp. BB11-1]|uniref:Sec-independent protein translocase protein TatB n=1 Tax=Corallococcus sp. BB11-1 TaxID=2996783 RepID=UPI0010CF814C|nr:Sec-independent protein translocase protein TatB [Corallococcus sp. BB11-1]MCY1035009.1 Sec-independent protein translocase protein TatB [Corallococcus sp. BB11-1]RYZ31336.1 MAG: twin-arginine translocase subunit TatB [Myxococcaceae bacterium]
MFNIGAGEMVFILVAALIVLGPQRLPELARAIGKFMREFRRQTDDVRNVVEREFYAMDEEFNRELPARPGTRVPSPPPELTGGLHHLPDGSLPNMLAEPAPSLTASLEPAHLPAPEAAAESHGPSAEAAALAVATGPQASPEAEGDAAGTEPRPGADGLPQLAPIPGTVARNAPKRS